MKTDMFTSLIAKRLEDLDSQVRDLKERISSIEESEEDLDLEFDNCREAFEDCEDISDLVEFLDEWVTRSALVDIFELLNKKYGYQFKATGSRRAILDHLGEQEDIADRLFEKIYEAIEEVVDIDEEE